MSAAQENQDRRAIIKDALARIENLQARLAAAERSRAEPIAIIGLGCRFPGGADGPDSYWRLLRNGVDAVREVPPDRWDVERYFDPDPHAPGKTYTRWGGYLDRVDMFDAEFFGIPPREAFTLDPQQRLFLEVVWEALEHAGLAPDKLRGSLTGVFLGLTTTEYLQHLNKVVGLEEMDAYHASGNTPNAASGRVAHLLGLHGPAVSLDTACSSSLVATHIACQSLRNGDCDMALAGGVNVILIPETYVCFSKWGMMSHVGRCKTFDASADGFVRSEGCGVVVLKRLSDAIASGDTILALIRGSAVNQDGPSSGLSVPNGLAQQNVIRRALENARVKPEEVGYVEAHGTGTTLGDPIEVEALGEVFGPGRTGGNPLAIGSVKTNLGHMESAAGIAGMIKVVLALQHREIPPHLHLSKLTPRIPWERLPFVVPTDRTPWPVALSPRIAGVSSFGFSGTNAHVVLEEAPPAPAAALGPERTHHLLALSAKNDRALRELAGRYVDRTLAGDSSWPDVCHTAGIGRSHFSRRAAVVAASSEEARLILSDFAGGGAPSGLSAGEVHGGRRPKIAFLFSGQGAQYVGMGRRLYETSPVFRETLDRCDELLEAHLERRLLSVLYPEDGAASPLDDTAYTQPALFALEYALAALWRSWGVTPSAVMGHSVGEYVAACLAGVMRLEDALELIAARGRLMQELPRDGAMAAIFTDEGRVAAALAGREDRVSIAAVNGPTNVVVSGRSDTVTEILDHFGAAGVRFRRLDVSHAFHSPLMDPILDSFERVASRVSYEAPRLPLVSGATGQLADADLIGRAGYWRRHVRQTVRFEASVRALHELGFRLFVEVGPGTTLLGMGRQCVSDPEAAWLHSLREGREDWSQILGSLGALYVRGAEVDWAALDRPYPRRRVSLPTYPFRRRRFWVDSKGGALRPADSALASASTVVRLIQEGNVRGLEQELAAAGLLPSDGAAVVPKVLHALIRRHRDEIAAEPRERMYELRWREQPRSTSRPAAGARTSGVWLVFADDGGIGRAVSAGLESRGARSVVVRHGSGPARDDEGTWRIDPARPEDYRTLIEKTSERAGASLAGVIHLWSLDTVRPEPMTLEALDAAQRLGCRSLLFLAQALAAARGSAAPRLWAVTRGTVPAEQPPLEASLAQAPVWGLGGVLALEIPEIWGGIVDLPADVGGDHAERLLEEVWSPDGEDQVALRAARRFVPRLVRHEASGAAGVPIAADGTYLVTGGLGGLGLEVAHWLARRGARHVMLLGRRGVATGEAKTSIERLEKIGVSVRVAAADVADPEAMDRILTELAASMPPLRGILHAAGVAGYRPVEEIDAASLAAVLRPKLAGTWNLYRLTRDMRLDFFVGFSSIASLWGSKGQAHYAAANFFLDAFAHTLRGQGRPALSVNWGPWTTGMSSADFQSFMARLGVRALSPEEATGALGAAIGSGRPQIAVATVDWRAFKAIYEARGRRPILDEVDARADPDAPAETIAPSRLRQDLEQAPPARREGMLIARIQAEVAAVMGFEPSNLPDPERGFFEAGMDSLMAVQLRDHLQRAVGTTLPATLAFDHPNILDLARHLLSDVLGLGPTTPVAERPPDPAAARRSDLLEQIKGLSEDTLERLVADELGALDGK